MKPTWDGWVRVLGIQKEDVSSKAPCLYAGHWNTDTRNWVPEISKTKLQWDTCIPKVTVEVEFDILNRIEAKEYDLWRPVGEERTTWRPVPYPK